MTNPAASRQWMPLDEVVEPFRTPLLKIFEEVPRTHSSPVQFDLSTSVDTGAGRQLWISGQVPRFENTVRYQGIVGLDVSVDTACAAARLSLSNLLSILAAACGGDLSRVDNFIRLTGYVRSTSAFTEHAKVIDAASTILNSIFGEKGRHVRSAIGVASLPGAASVELECVVQLK